MSIIRNLLYNGTEASSHYSGILYNQNLLHNFIIQHTPQFILHCGSSENAISLSHFIKEHELVCEILYVKNWHPSSNQWLQANGEAPDPHQVFLDRINALELTNYLVSFDGVSQTAYDVLNYRNFCFQMMVSDNLGDHTDYLPLLGLLQKSALHVRYVGEKKLCELKEEAIFQANIETPFTYAQGYLITGMDYLSLYENAFADKNNKQPDNTKELAENHIVQNITEIDNNVSLLKDTLDSSNKDKYITSNVPDTNNSDNNDEARNSREERMKRREERRKAREERQKKRDLERDESESPESKKDFGQSNDSNPERAFNDEDADSSADARRALREKRRAARRARRASAE